MKTNQILKVNFGGNILSIGHKDKMGNLTELVEIANYYRQTKGLSIIPVKELMRRKTFKEYVLMLENKEISKGGNITPLKITELKNVKNVLKSKRGKNGGTWAHLNIMIRVAIELDSEFADEVITTFVQGKILEYRDFAGDDFKILSNSLSIFQPNTKQRILMAKGLNYIVHNNHYSGIRNNSTDEQLSEFTKIQRQLAFAIDMGYIRTFDELINEMGRMWRMKWDKNVIN